MAVNQVLLTKILGGIGAAGTTVLGVNFFYNSLLDKWEQKKIDEINTKLTTLGIPGSCRFSKTSENEKNSKECPSTISEEDLKKIAFKDKGDNLTVEGTVSELKLLIERIETTDPERFGIYGDLKFTFKDFANTITLKKSGDAEVVKLVKDTNPEFRINEDSKLEKAWTADSLIKRTGDFSCTTAGGSNTCTLNTSTESKKLKINVGSEIKEITVDSSKLTNGFTVAENEAEHNQGFKFTFGGTNAETIDGVEIPANSNYEVKYENNGWYLNKKSS